MDREERRQHFNARGERIARLSADIDRAWDLANHAARVGNAALLDQARAMARAFRRELHSLIFGEAIRN